MIVHSDAKVFLKGLDDQSVDLFCIDPPYYGIVKDSWDNKWNNIKHYTEWLYDLLFLAKMKVKGNGSLIVFQGIGKHMHHPIFSIVESIEHSWRFRNWITWMKRRAYGKSNDYLFCREEILWFSSSSASNEFTFNIPLTNVKRGYEGWNKDYKAKSEFLRVSNVWTDINEIMKPERNCQKPKRLIERILLTHSNKGDLVCDFFSGWGTTGVVSAHLGRRFIGCEAIKKDVLKGNARISEALEFEAEIARKEARPKMEDSLQSMRRKLKANNES